MTTSIKTYSELIKPPTLNERFEYLRMDSKVGESTFGYDRYLNQMFYTSGPWLAVRDEVILRDDGCDMGLKDYPIYGRIIVHHMMPVTAQDIIDREPWILDPEFLITVSHLTHEAITFSNDSLLPKDPIIRKPNDTCPWRT